jgi:hypothetical protein
LLRFIAHDEQTVTVLADAGTHGGNYGRDHVLHKLRQATGTGPEDPLHINLLIGTHYDADHLNRMEAIIADPNITIGEAWMPPVADDTETPTLDRMLDDENLLALKLARDFESGATINKYLAAQKKECLRLSDTEIRILEFTRGSETAATTRRDPSDREETIEDIKAFFLEQIAETAEILGNQEETHADTALWDSADLDLAPTRLHSQWALRTVEAALTDPRPFDTPVHWHSIIKANSEEGRKGLALLKQSAAKKAINAMAMNDVVVALKQKSVPIYSRYIQDGEPRYFVWNPVQNRFLGVTDQTPGAVSFALLGPSQGLIEKHWKKLPVATRAALALTADIPIVGTTESNELSYVVHFRSEGQGVLVAGDTGCVDFKPSGRRKPYYKRLLAELTPLHVVQVSHHAGANAHFYRVLTKSRGASDLISSFLLISHETRSKHRPSDAFGKFVEKLRSPDKGPSLLFTSAPKKVKVSDFTDLLHDVVGTAKTEGDVRLEYDGNNWTVTRHAIDKEALI